jgi:oligopeptide/dipeptide ABC transporter ATP-binding protein
VAPILSVNHLTTSFKTEDGVVRAVNDVTFQVDSGEVLAIVGESGSGKSVTALSILQLLPRTASIRGEVLFENRDLLLLNDDQMREVRGKEIAMIFQDPMTALNPVFTVGNQIEEAVLVHAKVEKEVARERAIELLDLVGIPNPRQRVKSYPHEFSGGMRQRAMIAMGIANNPKVLIADEPTTALDVTIQAQVMEVMKEVQEATGAAMILITHDLGLVAGVADRVQVMYAGQVFESGATREIYYDSRNPYTQGLMRSIPRVDERTDDQLLPIRGAPPSLIAIPKGCPFRPRCDYAADVCRSDPPELRRSGAALHETRCHFADTLPKFETLVGGEPS